MKLKVVLEKGNNVWNKYLLLKLVARFVTDVVKCDFFVLFAFCKVIVISLRYQLCSLFCCF